MTPGAPAPFDLPPVDALLPEGTRADSLSDRAYYLIRELIVTLQLPPGAVVDERRLMRDLDLGRTPIREAVRRLAHEKLVTIYPRRGTVVTSIDLGDLGAISEVRTTLEGFAARLAAERATDQQRATAGTLMGELRASLGHSDQRRLLHLDQRIHRHVYRCTANGFLAATLDEYLVHALRLWSVVIDRIRRLDDAVREDLELLAAIRDGDPDGAEDVVRRHVIGFEREIHTILTTSAADPAPAPAASTDTTRSDTP